MEKSLISNAGIAVFTAVAASLIISYINTPKDMMQQVHVLEKHLHTLARDVENIETEVKKLDLVAVNQININNNTKNLENLRADISALNNSMTAVKVTNATIVEGINNIQAYLKQSPVNTH